MIALRRLRRSLASLAVAAFLAVWVGMAMAPCLMAAERVLGIDCPHCPDPPPCHEDAGSGRCSYIDGYDFDGRTPAFPKVELQLLALIPLGLEVKELPARPSVPSGLLARPPPDPGGPRLHLRHCVLRD